MAALHMRFPGGLGKALTLSYDDGVQQDVRLIEILDKNGLKGTFNINSGLYPAEGTRFPDGQVHRRMTQRQAEDLYKGSGHEVAVHGYTHPFLEQLSSVQVIEEILRDRRKLESQFGCLIRGMAYPFGTYNDTVVECLRLTGIAYARTAGESLSFDLPKDWLRLVGTCHHNNEKLMDLAETFAENQVEYGPQMFYLWGHSYEFEMDDNWERIETFAQYMGGRPDIWYATNMEIFDYVSAYKQLLFSADSHIASNPTAKDLYFKLEDKTYCVKAGETRFL